MISKKVRKNLQFMIQTLFHKGSQPGSVSETRPGNQSAANLRVDEMVTQNFGGNTVRFFRADNLDNEKESGPISGRYEEFEKLLCKIKT